MDRAISAPLRKRALTREVQKRIQDQVDRYWKDTISRYAMQGDFLGLLQEEDSNVCWKSYLWAVPRGIVKFAVNSGLNTLPSADNLRRWGKRTSDICGICNQNSKQTLHHILSNCSMALDQGRYTWRHDSVLRTLFDSVKGQLRDGFALFSDLIGHDAGGGSTFPRDIISTTQRPDMVVLSREQRKVFILELTCPWDLNVDRSHQYKMDKYASLVNDLSSDGFSVDLFCVEVSVRGLITKANKARFKAFIHKITDLNRASGTKILISLSKAALVSSFAVFCARSERTWAIQGGMSVNGV